MARIPGTLLGATERDVIDGEDRLTEILAAVLDRVPALATELNQLVGLPPAHRYEVSTQVVRGASRIDLQVLGIDNGRVSTCFWGEHKIDAALTTAQVAKYLNLLDAERAAARTLVLVVPSDRLRSLRSDVTIAGDAPAMWLSWQDVAMSAVRVARRRAGSGWRRTVERGDGPTGVALIAELVSALERRGLAHVDPFSVADVMALTGHSEAREAFWTLFERIPQHLDRLTGTANRSRRTPDFAGWWHVVDGPPSWPRESGGWSELFARSEDWWRPDDRAMDFSCVCAGFTFEAEAGRRFLEDPLSAWRQGLAEQDIDVFADGSFVRLCRPMYLNTIVTAGVTLDDQAAAVARWVEDTIATIEAWPPPA